MGLTVRTNLDGSVEVSCTDCNTTSTYSNVQGNSAMALQHHAITKHSSIAAPSVAALQAKGEGI